jgi:hypothetical protein
MRITGGISVQVYRNDTPRDRFGDTSAGEPSLVGTIDHCVFQWATSASQGLRFRAGNDFRETAEIAAMVFCPNDDPIKIQGRDRLKIDGHTYQVVGEVAWNLPHPATGYDFGYYMVQVEAVS